jgi:hypothetical protein
VPRLNNPIAAQKKNQERKELINVQQFFCLRESPSSISAIYPWIMIFNVPDASTKVQSVAVWLRL